jgi:hypothetical protein
VLRDVVEEWKILSERGSHVPHRGKEGGQLELHGQQYVTVSENGAEWH